MYLYPKNKDILGSEATQFKPGKGGRPKGVQNKITRSVKATVLAVFNDLQKEEDHNLEAFAKKYPRDFYNIAAKLIPTEVQATVEATVTWNEVKRYESPKELPDGANP